MGLLRRPLCGHHQTQRLSGSSSQGGVGAPGDGSAMTAILGQMEALEREHDTVGDALKNMRGLTPTRTKWSDGAEPAPAVAIRADRAISCCQRAFSAQPHPSATGYPRWDSALWGRPPRSSLWCGTDKTRAHYQR